MAPELGGKNQSVVSVEGVLSQFGRFLEFTRDINRNESDSVFEKAGGRIIYVFDENVFELLINPSALHWYVELFHSPLFATNISASDARKINAQSALIAGEYLFAGKLPGQNQSSIYMTEWHFGELSNRRREYVGWLKDEIDRISQSNNALTSLRPRATGSDGLEVLDRLTADDLKQFAMRTTDSTAVQRFRDARVLAATLVGDAYWDSLQQLRRIGTKEIAGRIIPLEARFRPTTDERISLRKEMRYWLNSLRTEEEKRQSRRGSWRDHAVDRPESEAMRKPRGLENDANTLAYLQWIARNKLAPRERLVLVTGDSLLFDVYRSWYVAQAPGEPFILRRVSQYAPIINLDDAQSDLAGCRELFQSTREAVEAALFVFNLSGPSRSLDTLNRGREYLAVKLSQYREPNDDASISAFAENLTLEWAAQRQQQFDAIIHLWQEMERFVVGIHYDFIVKRYNQDYRHRLAELVALGNQGTLVEFLRGILDDLVKGSIRLFFPFATDFIRNRPEKLRSRAPTTLRLMVPERRNSNVPPNATSESQLPSVEIHTLLDGWRLGDERALRTLDVNRNPTLSERPDIIYMIAAVLALEASEWGEAERFADLAKDAVPLIEVSESQSEADKYEAHYISALTKRFRLGSLDPRIAGLKTDMLHRLLDSSVDSLTLCEIHHSRLGEVLRHLRAVSERAAVRLFYASWGAITATGQGRSKSFGLPDTLSQFDLAIGDLRKCLELEPAAQAARQNRRRNDFHDRVQKQYIINFAAAAALRYALYFDLDVSSEALPPSEIDLVKSRLEAWMSDGSFKSLPSAARADVLIFQALESRSEDARQKFLKWSQEQRQYDVAIDRAIVEMFSEVMQRTQP